MGWGNMGPACLIVEIKLRLFGKKNRDECITSTNSLMIIDKDGNIIPSFCKSI